MIRNASKIKFYTIRKAMTRIPRPSPLTQLCPMDFTSLPKGVASARSSKAIYPGTGLLFFLCLGLPSCTCHLLYCGDQSIRATSLLSSAHSCAHATSISASPAAPGCHAPAPFALSGSRYLRSVSQLSSHPHLTNSSHLLVTRTIWAKTAPICKNDRIRSV